MHLPPHIGSVLVSVEGNEWQLKITDVWRRCSAGPDGIVTVASLAQGIDVAESVTGRVFREFLCIFVIATGFPA